MRARKFYRPRHAEFARFVALLAGLTSRRSVFQLVGVALTGFLIVAGAQTLLPIYADGTGPVARLASQAGSSGRDDREPLIVFSGLVPPTPLYYSNRPILVAYDADYLPKFITGSQPERIILKKSDMNGLSKTYDFQVLSEAKPYVYALVRLRG